MSWVAVAVGGGALVGGVLSSQAMKSGSQDAANASRYGADQAANVQRYMYDTSRSDFAPYLNVGTQALYDAFG